MQTFPTTVNAPLATEVGFTGIQKVELVLIHIAPARHARMARGHLLEDRAPKCAMFVPKELREVRKLSTELARALTTGAEEIGLEYANHA